MDKKKKYLILAFLGSIIFLVSNYINGMKAYDMRIFMLVGAAITFYFYYLTRKLKIKK